MSAKNITRVTLAEAKSMKGRTDWQRLRSMTDEEIEANAASDPDCPPLDPERSEIFGVLRRPNVPKVAVELALDEDVAAFLESKPKHFRTAWANNALMRQMRREMDFEKSKDHSQ